MNEVKTFKISNNKGSYSEKCVGICETFQEFNNAGEIFGIREMQSFGIFGILKKF